VYSAHTDLKTDDVLDGILISHAEKKEHIIGLMLQVKNANNIYV